MRLDPNATSMTKTDGASAVVLSRQIKNEEELPR
jgi:hypothetical protein